MTDLSPAALSVMLAATNGNALVAEDPVYKQCIANALRAAVNEMSREWGYYKHHDYLRDIADELNPKQS